MFIAIRWVQSSERGLRKSSVLQLILKPDSRHLNFLDVVDFNCSLLGWVHRDETIKHTAVNSDTNRVKPTESKSESVTD